MPLLTYNVLLGILIAIATIVFFLYFLWDFNYWKRRNVPFMMPFPIVGNFGGLLTGRDAIFEVIGKAYKHLNNSDLCGIWVLTKPGLVVRSPEIIKDVLIKDFSAFSDRTIASDIKADPVVAHILFVAKNPLWRSLRAKISPAFSRSKINLMVPLMNDTSKEFIEYVHAKASLGPIETREVCSKYAIDVLTICVYGIKANCFKYEDADFRQVGRKLTNFTFVSGLRALTYFLAPSLVNIFKFALFERSLTDFLGNAFFNAIEERKRSGIKRDDILDIITQMIATNEFDNNEALAQAVQFFTAGYETTASTIAYSLYELARNESCQTQLRDELKQWASGRTELNYETIKSFKYLNQVVRETLRMYPVLPFLDRQCGRDYQISNSEVIIEKGTKVYIPIMALHYDEKYFPHPNVFNPDRFNETNIQSINPHAYLPFGTGPRNCIGDRFGLIATQIAIISIITNFKVDYCDETPKKVTFSPKSFILQPKMGIYLKFTPIKE